MIIALFGAAGKMGSRITAQLKNHPEYQLRCVETSPEGQASLVRNGCSLFPAAKAVLGADAAILAVPDRVIGAVAAAVIPQLRAGAMVITLDPAAAWAGVLPLRAGLSYFVTHPCHPSVFAYESDPEAHADHSGGHKAWQPIVCALLQGTEADYARGEALARVIFGRVSRVHRLTVEQMAILEPAMAETVAASLIQVMREAMDEAIRRGVPPDAARDFMLGHIRVPLAIAFEQAKLKFSDGARLIMEYGRAHLLQPGWKQIFEPEKVKEQVQAIVRGQKM